MNTRISYAGGIVSIFSTVTLNEWAILIGIATAVLTFFINVWHTRRKDAREQRLLDLAEQEARARLAALGLKP